MAGATLKSFMLYAACVFFFFIAIGFAEGLGWHSGIMVLVPGLVLLIRNRLDAALAVLVGGCVALEILSLARAGLVISMLFGAVGMVYALNILVISREHWWSRILLFSFGCGMWITGSWVVGGARSWGEISTILFFSIGCAFLFTDTENATHNRNQLHYGIS
ncbi:MAG: hypothetical protein COT39_03970 [Parcubacteria group bacterium CG08_land_8_20_14_0_20_48_21]|nr:MAG: hypothetical protein COT39_03970 [Parcubacteria group bacterium CG08_land_8_20_14_0_20_48_21]PIW79356.1 MAG: hypothetical protein COZ99_01515 [Parcubacteria group bacterium CG_4_8_14_3_um_filter_48_16]